MGYKHDQNYWGETYRPDQSDDQPSQSRGPPALPPRSNSNSAAPSPSFQPPPSYSEAVPTYHSQPLTQSWSSQDPRSSSTQSLVPAGSGEGKKTLLLIFIHGFLGNEQSFQSFPAHVHNLVTANLADSHVVHTKIYPRYKSRKPIEYATDDFSNWLCPHESPDTEVILLGHSMGGILAAEVALLPPYSRSSPENFRHRIRGTINFDCPFLGMHPGVVVSGIGSLFRSAPDPSSPQSPDIRPEKLEIRPVPASNDMSPGPLPVSPSMVTMQSSSNSVFSESNANLTQVISADHSSINSPQILLSPTTSQDPNYNPPFVNDMVSPVRTGWDSVIHFVTKHSDGLNSAAKSYVTSHLDFGKCLADYKGLKNRYSRIRGLEDHNTHQNSHSTRIRFVNYYTASTGRPKKIKSAPQINSHPQSHQIDSSKEPIEQEMRDMSISTLRSQSLTQCPRISIEEHLVGNIYPNALQDPDEHTFTAVDGSPTEDIATPGDSPGMSPIEAASVTDKDSEEDGKKASNTLDTAASITSGLSEDLAATSLDPDAIEKRVSLPPLGPSPKPPPEFRPEIYADKDARQLAHKEYARQNKAYMKSLKDFTKSIRDREKLTQKREKAAEKIGDKKLKLAKTERSPVPKDEAKGKNAPTLAPLKSASASRSGLASNNSSENRNIDAESGKSTRDKKFCMLPPKINDQIDPCWVRIFMRDVDEVGAHCGLFLLGDHYEWLVSDVGNRIKQWVEEG